MEQIRPTQLSWASEGPRRAGVTALGIGGTNVHVVLEEAPAPAVRAVDPAPQVLVVSARSAYDQTVSSGR